MKLKSHPSVLGVLRVSTDKAERRQGRMGGSAVQRPPGACSDRSSLMQPHHNMRMRSRCWEQHLLRCLCVCGVCEGGGGGGGGCQASRSAGRRPQGQGGHQGSLTELPQLETDESSPRSRGNKRQKYLDRCSSSRIEYLHPATTARTWLDPAKAQQKPSKSLSNARQLSR